MSDFSKVIDLPLMFAATVFVIVAIPTLVTTLFVSEAQKLSEQIVVSVDPATANPVSLGASVAGVGYWVLATAGRKLPVLVRKSSQES